MGSNSVHLAKKLPNSAPDLIHQLQSGNAKAFTSLYSAYAPTIFNRIKSTVPCAPAAEEILQNVFLKIWLHINNYNSEKSSLFTWMISIARNECIDYLRSKQAKNKRLTSSINANDVEVEIFMELRLDRLDVLKSLKKLPSKEQTILELYNIGYTCREVSNLLSLPEGTVKTKMRRSFIKLRSILA